MSAIDETNDLTEWDILFIYNKQNVKDILKKKAHLSVKEKLKVIFYLLMVSYMITVSWTNSSLLVVFFFEKFLKENLLCDVRKTELGELLNVI